MVRPLRYAFVPMRAEYAGVIAAWRYPADYAFYDWPNDPDDLAELLDAASWPGRYYAAVAADGTVIGFLQATPTAEAVEIGLGLRPDLTGHGYGNDFLAACLRFVAEHHPAERFPLAVAAFNRRAITVYERAGFRVTGEYNQRANGGTHRFLTMERPARGEE